MIYTSSQLVDTFFLGFVSKRFHHLSIQRSCARFRLCGGSTQKPFIRCSWTRWLAACVKALPDAACVQVLPDAVLDLRVWESLPDVTGGKLIELNFKEVQNIYPARLVQRVRTVLLDLIILRWFALCIGSAQGSWTLWYEETLPMQPLKRPHCGWTWWSREAMPGPDYVKALPNTAGPETQIRSTRRRKVRSRLRGRPI